MKTTIRPTFPSLADWVNATWPLLTGRPNPVKIPKAAQAAADSQVGRRRRRHQAAQDSSLKFSSHQ